MEIWKLKLDKVSMGYECLHLNLLQEEIIKNLRIFFCPAEVA